MIGCETCDERLCIAGLLKLDLPFDWMRQIDYMSGPPEWASSGFGTRPKFDMERILSLHESIPAPIPFPSFFTPSFPAPDSLALDDANLRDWAAYIIHNNLSLPGVIRANDGSVHTLSLKGFLVMKSLAPLEGGGSGNGSNAFYIVLSAMVATPGAYEKAVHEHARDVDNIPDLWTPNRWNAAHFPRDRSVVRFLVQQGFTSNLAHTCWPSALHYLAATDTESYEDITRVWDNWSSSKRDPMNWRSLKQDNPWIRPSVDHFYHPAPKLDVADLESLSPFIHRHFVARFPYDKDSFNSDLLPEQAITTIIETAISTKSKLLITTSIDAPMIDGTTTHAEEVIIGDGNEGEL
jgi:hypothetical protein